MKIIKTANGKKTVKISRNELKLMGRTEEWLKKIASVLDGDEFETLEKIVSKMYDSELKVAKNKKEAEKSAQDELSYIVGWMLEMQKEENK
jgi:hypothetical protein